MNVIHAGRLVGDIGDARHAVFGGRAVPVPVVESVHEVPHTRIPDPGP